MTVRDGVVLVRVSQDTPTGAEAPRWRGVNDLALITSDTDATVRFLASVPQPV